MKGMRACNAVTTFAQTTAKRASFLASPARESSYARCDKNETLWRAIETQKQHAKRPADHSIAHDAITTSNVLQARTPFLAKLQS